MKLNLNFLGGGGVKNKKPSVCVCGGGGGGGNMDFSGTAHYRKVIQLISVY